jgi:hypothetical protein
MPTNQEVINAVYAAAAALGLSSGWGLLARAGLTHLVRDRQGAYSGPAIDNIDTLSNGEKTHIKAELPPPPPTFTPRPLAGKGYFIWWVNQCEEGNPQRIAAAAQAAGLTHVLIKVAHGPSPYRYNILLTEDRVAPLVTALRTIPNFQVWGWQYTFGERPEAEARVAVDLVKQYKLDGFVINAEKEYKRAAIKPNAERYATTLRQKLVDAQLDNLPVALSSYRYPQWHSEFPWQPFLNVCSVVMPQVYWVSRSAPDPAGNLQTCLRQYQNLGWTGPIVPTGAAYDEWQWASDGTKWLWSTAASEIRRFLPAVKSAGLQAVNFWSWQHAGTQRWRAVSDFQW